MNRRDYEALASVLKEVPQPYRDTLALRVGTVLAADNHRFDWFRWLRACEASESVTPEEN